MIKAKFQQLIKHKGFQRYGANTAWLIGEKLLRMTIGLLVGIWVARYLGPEQFGLLNYAQSFVGLFAAIATLGLNGIVVRELVKDSSRAGELIGTVFLLKLAGAVVILSILGGVINLTSDDTYTNVLVFIIASATIFQSFNVIDLYFQSKVMSKYVVFSNFISLLLSSIIKVVLVLSDAPLVAFAWVVLFDSLILGAGFIYFYIKDSSLATAFNLTFSKNLAFFLLKESWPLILSGIVVSIYMKIDQVMIKEILGSNEVGQYAAAVRLSEIWYFIPVSISASLFPSIIYAKKTNEKLYNKRLQDLYYLLTWIALSLAVPVTFVGGELVELLYGSQYSESGGVLVIHIWAGLFVFLGVARSGWVLNESLQKYTFLYLTAALIINVVLNFYWLPVFGVIGAAYATLVSQCFAVLVAPALFKKTRVSSVMIMKSLCLIPSFFRLKKRLSK